MRGPWINGLRQALAALLLYCLASSAFAACTDRSMMNPIDDVVWDCIFPISIMGIPLDFGEHPPDNTNSMPLCECPGEGIYGLGFMVSFWEPARMVETVSDAWCFPSLGTSINGGSAGSGYFGGGSLRRDVSKMTFQHYHYFETPFWAILDMFTDIPCLTDEAAWDLVMVSEVRPDWGDDLTAAQYYPETSLMANPGVVMACVADAMAAAAQRTLDFLYWCIGAWGTTYPMSGHMTTKDYVAANAGIAAKAMYVQSRMGGLGDRAVNYCNTTYMPIWVKSHWRIQETDPAVDRRCHVLGHPGILWTQRKNPVGRQDNFAWLLFRKVECCVVVF